MSLSAGACLTSFAELIRRCYRLAIDFENHIASGQACIFCRATRLYLRNRDSLYLRRKIQLLAHIRREIGDRDAQPGMARLAASRLPRLPGLCGIPQPSGRSSQDGRSVPRPAGSSSRARLRLPPPEDHFRFRLAGHSHQSPHRPASRPARLAGESGVTEAISAPVFPVRLKNFALSGVTSFNPTPRYP